jgi:hypothetical protein
MFKVMYMQNVADSTSDIHRFEMVSKYYYYYYHILIIMYNAAKDNIIHVHSWLENYCAEILFHYQLVKLALEHFYLHIPFLM